MLIHTLMSRPLSGAAIEERSMALIDELCPAHRFTPPEWRVAQRLVHTTGDPRVVGQLAFGEGWLAAGAAALRRGATVFCDARMVQAGLALPRLHRQSAAPRPEDGHTGRPFGQEDGSSASLQLSQTGLLVLRGSGPVGGAAFGSEHTQFAIGKYCAEMAGHR